MIPWRRHARRLTSAALVRITAARTAIAPAVSRARREIPVLRSRIITAARTVRSAALRMRTRPRHRKPPDLLPRILLAARSAVLRMRTRPRHRKSPDLLPRILIAALAVIALAAGFIPGILSAGAAPAALVTHSRAVTRTVHAAVISDKALIFRARARAAAQAAARAAAILAAHTYTVRPGDSLSSVAERRCGPARDWTGIYAASRAHRWTAANANVLTAGQHLYLTCAYLPSMLKFAPAPPPPVIRAVTVSTGYRRVYRNSGGRAWGVSYGYPNYCGDGDHDGWDVKCSSIRHVYSSGARSYRHGGSSYRRITVYRGSRSTYSGSGGCQSHIIHDESGGNARAVNPSSGAGGLYQFLPSTWHALGHGGLPQNASVAEQNQAYHQQVSQSGYSAWAASGGC